MTRQRNTVIKLTALWAMSESALGGLLHALKIPVTGFVLGAFAVVITGMIAHYSRSNFKVILQSTLLVMMVKAAVSPYTPVPAYVAVGFQGLLGAILYRFIPSFTFASLFFGPLALLESAVQKFAMDTLIYGKNLWTTVDMFFNSIMKQMGILSNISGTFWVIGTYCSIYFLWGIIIGWWLSTLPTKLINFRTKYPDLQLQPEEIKTSKNIKKGKWIFFATLLFLASTLIFLIPTAKGIEMAFYTILRSIAILLIWLYILQPLIQKYIRVWLEKKKSDSNSQFIEVMNLIPSLKNWVKPAYSAAQQRGKGFKKYAAFVTILIYFSLDLDE